MINRSIRYSENFKKTIVKLYSEEKRSASSLAKEYGITVSTITKWIHQYQEVSLPNGKIVTAKEYARLEKEKRELKEELEILKQAAVLLAKH